MNEQQPFLSLGVDPGSWITGIGLVRLSNHAHTKVAYQLCGTISLPKKSTLSERLFKIHQDLTELFETHRPSLMTLERSFVYKNAHTALILGHVRGVCLLCAKQFNTPALEVPPATLKQYIASKGNASKTDVRTSVCRILSLKSSPSFDASDALALAIYGANSFVRTSL